MVHSDPDVANFRRLRKERAAARQQMSLQEQREAFDREMESIPIAAGCTTERLNFDGVPAERIAHPGVTAGKTLLYFHGGGYALGGINSHRHLVSRLAVASGLTAVHIDYRLAPEHPYPAALEDALKAYQHILRGNSPENLIVGGESAGGNLAVALMLKLRDQRLPLPRAAYLLSPWLDMTQTSEAYQKVASRDPMITIDVIRPMAAAFLGKQSDTPMTSPVRADPADLPPMLIQVGTDEVLLSDSTTFAKNAAIAGVEVRLHVWPEMPHAWPLFHPLIRAGLSAIEEAGAWMRAKLSAPA
jgi:monoterpene epsilon-lactone hydrolase